jgi:NADH-quinone oxidoreductase subunit K
MLAALLFGIGAFGAFSRRNAVAILMGVELMLNAVNINLVAFWRYVAPQGVEGLMFVIFSITVAAAEVAVALALVLALYRTRDTVNVGEIDLLKW